MSDLFSLPLPKYIVYGGEKIAVKDISSVTFSSDDKFDIVIIHYLNGKERTFRRPSDYDLIDGDDWKEVRSERVKNGNIRN